MNARSHGTAMNMNMALHARGHEHGCAGVHLGHRVEDSHQRLLSRTDQNIPEQTSWLAPYKQQQQGREAVGC
jgi:hypothetical protein